MIQRAMPSVTESNTLADLITAARGDLPMRELARRSGLSAAQISRIEAGTVESPTSETLVKLARGLDRDSELLLAALGKMDGKATAEFVLRSLPDSGSPVETPALAAARIAIEQAQQQVIDLAQMHMSLSRDWQVLATKHDELQAEAKEIETEIGALKDSEPYAEDAARMAGYRMEAETRRKRVQHDLGELSRRGGQLQREMKKCRTRVNAAVVQRSKAARAAAGELFVSGATSRERELEALLAGTIDTPLGSETSQLLSELVAAASAAQSDQLKRAVAEVSKSTARLEANSDVIRKYFAETWRESAAKTRAELEQAMKQLRNQLAHGAGDADFRRMAAAWNRLTPERRQKVLDFVDDQRRLSMQEQLEQAPTKKEVIEIEQASARSRRS